jgi:hypothetical protein
MRFNINSCICYKGLLVLRKNLYMGMNEVGDLTRVPMFGKSLPFDSDTSICRKKVLFRYKMGSYLRNMRYNNRTMKMCMMDWIPILYVG